MEEDKDEIIASLISRNKELNAKNEKLRDETEKDYTSVYLNGIYDERDKWIKKINKKIDEVTAYGFDNVIEVLQELLEEGE